jgi:hypothetical protein
MTEPRRLLESSSAASRLLRAGLRDNPGSSAARRAAVALGLGTASVSAATSAAALGGGTTASTLAVVGASATSGAAGVASAGLVAIGAKWTAIGLLSGTLVAGGASAFTPSPARVPSPLTTAAIAPLTPQGAPQPDPAGVPVVDRASTTEFGLPPGPAGIGDPPAERTPRAFEPKERTTNATRERIPRIAPAATTNENTSKQAGSTRGETGGLGRDLSQIDATRRALKARDPKRAEALLDGYDRARRTDFFEREALVLRIEALVQRGEHARAAELASDFFRRFPEDVHAPRIRSLLSGSAPKANGAPR